MKKALTTVTILAVALAFPVAASAVTAAWKGQTSTAWSANNWVTTAGGAASPPVNGDTVEFDINSASNLSTNNDISNLSLAGITNTSTAGSGPAGNVSIGGNALTLGSGGINFTGAPNAAVRNLAINTDLTLSAAQTWKMGGVGLTLAVGTSPGTNTVTMNGNALTMQLVGNVEFMILNSNLVNGSSASTVNVSPNASTSKTQFRFLGTNTYTGGTNSTGANQVLQLGSSSAAGSGPLGTGTINLVSGPTYFEAYNTVDSTGRTLDNAITLGSGSSLIATTSTGQTSKTLTLKGAISSPTGNRTILTDSQSSSAGSGDLIINGNLTLGSSGVAGGTLTTGQTATPIITPGKVIYNGNILEAAGVTSGAIMSVANGSPTNPTQVVLNGQNTYSGGTTFGAGGGIVYLGSSSAGPAGSPTSGPLGKGALTFNNGGNTPRIEAAGNQTVGNNVVMTSSGIVQGTSDLTLSGTISAAGNLTKNGAGKLTLTGTNSFNGSITVNAGTVSVPVIAANGTNQPLGTASTAIPVGAAATAGTLEYTGAAATTLGRQITAGAGGATIRATAATGTGLTLNAATAVSAGANPVTFDGAGNITVATPISGTTATLTKTGGGTLSLQVGNTYSGGTTVSVGTLSVNNTTGSGTGSGNVTVSGGATLQGTGIIAGNVLSSGTFSPGNSIGVITLDGTPIPSLSLQAGNYKYEINSTTVAADRTDVRGNLNITAGTALAASDLGGTLLAMGTKFTLINYGGTWNGGTFNGLPNYDTSLVLGPNRFQIIYNDTSGGSNLGGGAFGTVGQAHWATLTAVPEAGAFLTVGLGGIFAIAAVWMSKRLGVNVLKV